MCSSPAKSSLATSFDAVDDFERISSARISSAVEQFAEEIRSDVNSTDDAGMQKGELKNRFDAHDIAAHAEAVRVRNRKHYSLAPLCGRRIMAWAKSSSIESAAPWRTL